MNCIFEHSANPSNPSLFIECIPQDGQVVGFPLSHLIRFCLETNPGLPDSFDAPPEQLTLEFSTYQAVITGRHLEPIVRLLQRGRCFTVKAAGSRYQNLEPKQTFVSEICISKM